MFATFYSCSRADGEGAGGASAAEKGRGESEREREGIDGRSLERSNALKSRETPAAFFPSLATTYSSSGLERAMTGDVWRRWKRRGREGEKRKSVFLLPLRSKKKSEGDFFHFLRRKKKKKISKKKTGMAALIDAIEATEPALQHGMQPTSTGELSMLWEEQEMRR